MLWSAVGRAELDPDACPEVETDACVKTIRGMVERSDYELARRLAVRQCVQALPPRALERQRRHLLYRQALGCYYAYSLESVLGNFLRADRARRLMENLAREGCRRHYREYCLLLEGVVIETLQDLLAQFRADYEELEGIWGRRLGLRRLAWPLGLPADVKNVMRAYTVQALASDRGSAQIPCDGCETRWAAEDDPRRLAQFASDYDIDVFVDVTLILTADAPSLTVTFTDAPTLARLWSKTYVPLSLANTDLQLTYANLIRQELVDAETYVPEYRFQVGFMVQQYENLVSSYADDHTLGLFLRSGERLYDRWLDIGLALGVTGTLRKMTGHPWPGAAADAPAGGEGGGKTTENAASTSDPARAGPEDLAPYPTAAQIYGYGNLGVWQPRSGRFRLALHVGAGVHVVQTLYMAPIARVGLEWSLGSRLVMGAAALLSPESVGVLEDGREFDVPQRSGREVWLSLSL